MKHPSQAEIEALREAFGAPDLIGAACVLTYEGGGLTIHISGKTEMRDIVFGLEALKMEALGAIDMGAAL